MRMKFTLLNLFVLLNFIANAQDLTGIWRGYFVQNTFGIYEDRYKFEIQIEQTKTNAIKGVTYSYKTTVFYGKADLQGLYTKKSKNLIINETKLFEVKISDESTPCLMTCYLDFDKMGELETLSGTYTSRNLKNMKDCGNGKVYLERVATSDFYKEDFLVQLENKKKKVTPPVVRKTIKPKEPVIARQKPPVAITPDKKVKPGAEENLIAKEEKKSAPVVVPQVEEKPAKPVEKPLPPKPEVVKKRYNDLVKTIYTSAKEIKIQLYDNGEIDGDTITVYHNNELIVSKKRLTDKPITFTIAADEGSWEHEFVMVAENLGSIPPNTALMVITAGDKRYELFITSSDKKNAVVVLEYKPD
ncbi:MAG: hypothetical protein LH478_06800 [Chitinophagaceae bacterium]|nr:hypothetical protein [Chitinophagaceae bacterium]